MWVLMKTLNNNSKKDIQKDIFIWSAYNLMILDKNPNNTHCVTPILQNTSADWLNLYSAIFAASKLNQNIGHSQKTIVTRYLQLYMK